MTQLTLFGDDAFNDDRPLPEIIASTHHFPLQYHDTENGRVYAVQDWTRGVAKIDDARGLIAQMKRRAPDVFTSCKHMPYKQADGRTYKRDYADAEGLYAITQRMDTNTGLRNAVLAYLAKAGVKLDEYRRDPAQMVIEAQGLLKRRAERYVTEGRDPAWAGSRGLGIMSHAAFKAELYRVCPSIRFGVAINTEYRGLFGSDASGLRQQRGLAQRQEVRDGLTLSELHLLGWVEAQVSELFGNQDSAPEHECLRVIEEIASRARLLTGGIAS
jgi:hypothetical protein